MTDFIDTRDFIKGDLVKYVPVHARGNERHPDCQFGLVKSVNNIGVWDYSKPLVANVGLNPSGSHLGRSEAFRGAAKARGALSARPSRG